MDYEMQDYRKPPEDIGRWPTYYVPQRFIREYFFKFFVFFYMVPLLFFGVFLLNDVASLFMYFMFYDVIQYWSIKIRVEAGQ